MRTETLLQIDQLSYQHPNGQPALHKIQLQINTGQTVCLLGASGSGKTTLLRLIQGRIQPTSGTVQVAYPNLAVVSQEYALFPHLNVWRNIAMVLRRQETITQRIRPATAAVRDRAHQLLAQVGLSTAAERYPAELSGGQRQRVAVAQALAQQARLILMDEPFGALDEHVRAQLQDLLINLQAEHQFGLLFVTHDVAEALYLGHQIQILRPSSAGSTCEPYPITGNPQAIHELKQSEVFFKQIQTLRAHYYREQSIAADPAQTQAAIDRGLIDETLLANIERQAQQIWVISQRLNQDGNNPLLHAAVWANIQAGKTYRYIIPTGDPVAAANREQIKQTFADYAGQIRFDELPADTSIFYFGEVVLYDPTEPTAQGYSYLHGEERGFLVHLPDEFVQKYVRFMIQKISQ